MAQIERGEARIQRRISIKKALDAKVIIAGFCFEADFFQIPSENEQLGMGVLAFYIAYTMY